MAAVAVAAVSAQEAIAAACFRVAARWAAARGTQARHGFAAAALIYLHPIDKHGCLHAAGRHLAAVLLRG